MELRHLRYFIAVADLGSVRRASEQLYISQPAVSRQIHALELELGTPLFVRSRRGVMLSLAGQTFLTRARQILSDVESATETTRRMAAGLEGILKLAFVENASWDGLLPSIFAQLENDAPGIRLELTPLNTPEQITRLQEGKLDGGFIYPFDTLPTALSATWLVDNDVVVALPRAWGGSTQPLVLRDLADRAFITFPRHIYPAYHDRLFRLCAQLGMPLPVIQEVSTEAAILSLVSSGMGAAIVNSANRNRAPARVMFITLEDLSIPMPLTFVHRRDNLNPALKKLRQVIESVTASESHRM